MISKSGLARPCDRRESRALCVLSAVLLAGDMSHDLCVVMLNSARIDGVNRTPHRDGLTAEFSVQLGSIP